MLFGEILAVALGAIRANKLRSFLTALGIVIGVAAVITMVAIGSGAQKAVQDQIQALGTNLLSVFPGQQMFGGIAGENRANMKVDDAMALAIEGTTFANVLPELQRNLQVKYGNKNGNVRIIGATSNYPEVKNFKIEHGQMFTNGEDESRKRVAVIGSGIPTIFNVNGAAMVGQELQIGGISYEIVGTLAAKGASGGFQNQDEQILIPLNTARYRAFGTDRINSITIQVRDPDSVNIAMLQIERILRREHAIPPGSDNDFQIRNQAEFLSAFQQTTQTFTLLLAGIAAVSLIVGGIGIMNIMLVSVTERTREIGVRKALGATRGNIMLQFLIEAVVLCVLGGAIGVALGSGSAYGLAKLFRWNTLVSPSAIIMSFVFSATVGIIFGLWPARRAASLDPIVALRYE
ncbi:MAG: FtsX-like permease family protein [Gemmatimonadetes bacterium]|nr:FtsX-like permease family protein [Gemmatimonadota bacterium]